MPGRIEGIRTRCPRSSVGGRDRIHLIAWEKALRSFDLEAWAGALASWTRSKLFRSTCWAGRPSFIPSFQSIQTTMATRTNCPCTDTSKGSVGQKIRGKIAQTYIQGKDLRILYKKGNAV
ncbi:hypothetical protein Tco_1423365 [Tanacetum coccineum]